ncbi:MAG: AraC family ligand binding domain-containing protein [Pseudomonadota bacterium]
MEKVAPQVMNAARRQFVPRFSHGDMAGIAEVTGETHGTRLGTGFARFRNAEIPWTVKYDEVMLVLEGRVSVRTADATLEAGPQDCIWLPEGTSLTYVAEEALVFYAIEPSDWAQVQT